MGAAGLGYRQVIGRFYQRLEAVTAVGWADALSFLVNTDQESEDYKWLGQSPAVREWVGGRAAKGLRESGIRIVNKVFEATLDISVDELRRDKTGQLQVRINNMAERVAEHWAKLLTAQLVANPPAYDGADFFSVSHAEGDSGTQINALAAATISQLNISAPANPTVAEMEDNIIRVCQHMLGYKDDQGEPCMTEAKEFLVMVPTNMMRATAAALSLPLIIDGGATRNNLLVNLAGFNFRMVVNPRLTTDTVWYMFRTDGSVKPFIRQEELFETGTEDEAFKNNRILFGVKAIRNVGTAWWQYAAQVTFS